MKIIHVGLEKTYTTYLQKEIFPKICKVYNFRYNPYVFNVLAQQNFILLNNQKKISNELKNELKKDIFLSYEQLIGSNPYYWDLNAKRNLKLFGHNSVIIITVRTTKDYLSSLYAQKIKRYHLIKPEDFFLKKKDYEKIHDYIQSPILYRYPVYKFDLKKLYMIYKKKFKKVYVVPVDVIKTGYPFIEIFKEIEGIKNIFMKFNKHKIYNKSLSRRSIKLFFCFEKFLNFFNLRSINLDTRLIRLNTQNKINPKTIKFKNLTPLKKISMFNIYLRNKIKTPRRDLLLFLDKFLKYEKFYLEDYLLDKNLSKKNDLFIKSLNKKILKIANF